MKKLACLLLVITAFLLPRVAARAAEEAAEPTSGYYRYPAVHNEDVIFTAEGDLWRVDIRGGVARRLTSHPGQEILPAISPDGETLAFSAEYEGPVELYTMPMAGGPPTRRTFEGDGAYVAGWTPDGKVLFATRHYSKLPDFQLATLDLKTGATTVLPLSQASGAVFDPTGKTIYFTRQWFQGSHTKRYKGGTAQNLWKYTPGGAEAVPLTADFAGTSKNPMFWEDRIYFLSDRDGIMNLWSMNLDGGDLQQHTAHKGWDIKWASLSEGRIVYQMGADLHALDIVSKEDSVIPITLESDFDQEREKWVKRPLDYLTTFHLSPDGDRLVLTARGQVFVAPARQGRFVDVTRKQSVRYRQADFMPDGKSLVVLSDESGELEFDTFPANGIGASEQISHDGKIFRFDPVVSPDGKWVAYQDKNQELWLFDVKKRESHRIAKSSMGGFGGLHWSPDSEWLAYNSSADNQYERISLHHLKDGSTTILTSDRVNSYDAVWSPDGKWMYFLSERHLESSVGSPWGSREPEPFFNNTVKIYQLSLRKDGRSVFEPNDELHPGDEDKKKTDDDADSKDAKTKAKADKAKKPAAKGKAKTGETNKAPEVVIDLDGLTNRVTDVPVPPGNYGHLGVNAKHLFWQAGGFGATSNPLMTLEFTNDDPKAKTFAEQVKDYELSQDGKKIVVWKGDDFFVVDADSSAPAKLEKSVDLKGWTFPLDPREEWRQMFVESWRLMRDFFYDPNMHGVDWAAMRAKYEPLVARVTDRAELSDLIADMVGELSALHIFVYGGDFRSSPDQVNTAGLGAEWTRDEKQGGYRIGHIFRTDPDYPERLSPLLRPDVNLQEGDVITLINGVSTLTDPDPNALLRNQAGRQVLLDVKPAHGDKSRQVIVTPISREQEADLRYDDWEYSRRLEVESQGKGDLGYVHLRAMSANDIATWARDFYPVYNRQGLIIDVRHNGGGNIDSWILEKLLRKAWFYWQPRVGNPTWNMQYAFRGHVVVLCDERTGSDGEAFTEGFKRLGLGKVIGTRTWGGEIWLASDNWLVDKGIATAAEFGVYGPEGKWLIEGHGVDPDTVVDNLPHGTFAGDDAQLKAAIDELQEEIRLQPVTVPPAPPHPDKSFR